PVLVPQLHPQPRGRGVGLSRADGAQPPLGPRSHPRPARLRARHQGRGGAQGADESPDAPGRDPAADREPSRPRRPRDEAPGAPARASDRVNRASGRKAGPDRATSDQRPGAVARTFAPISRTTSTMRSTSRSVVRQFTIAGLNATLPAYSVVPKSARAASSTLAPT